eukprot:962594-Amphidinium_carterae.1
MQFSTSGSLEPTAIQGWIGGTPLAVNLKDLLGGKEMDTKDTAVLKGSEHCPMALKHHGQPRCLRRCPEPT